MRALAILQIRKPSIAWRIRGLSTSISFSCTVTCVIGVRCFEFVSMEAERSKNLLAQNVRAMHGGLRDCLRCRFGPPPWIQARDMTNPYERVASPAREVPVPVPLETTHIRL